MSKDERAVKVFFSLECEDGWPPVSVESVWARSTDEPHHYLIENTPFFVHSATLGDIVVAKHRPSPDKSEAETLWFHERVNWGGNALIRLIIRQNNAKDTIVAWLERAGCVCESFDRFSIVAVSVPREVVQAFIQGYLLCREEAGEVYVEEAILRG